MTKNPPIVSVIIPVYNVSKYLNSCVESIIRQTYKNMEIILVDDGSTDNSGILCDEWKTKDQRIKVFHKQNEGLNMARSSGFELSVGDYITFVDSDDLLHIDTIKNTVSIATKERVDTVIYQFIEFSDQEKVNLSSPIAGDDYDIRQSTESAFRLLIANEYENLYPMTAWGKLYRRNLIETVDWSVSNFRAFEDNFFTPQIFDKINSFAILKQQFYFYRRNASSVSVLSKTITGNSRNGHPVEYLEYINLLRDFWTKFIKKHNLDLEEDLQEFWLSNMLFRFHNLIEANAICQENNTQYISSLIEYLLYRHSRDVNKKEAKIKQLYEENKILKTSIDTIETELRTIKTVRGSLRNTGQQIKRRLKDKN